MLPSQRDARSGSEYPRPLALWLELDYFRRLRPLRRTRAKVTLAIFAASLAGVAALAMLPRNQRVFQAAPVSTAHAMIQDDCSACHTVPFGTARRLWHASDTVHSVTDEACLKCHTGAVHHGDQIGETSCAACHHEHKGPSGLARVDQNDCTQCHANLKEHTDLSKKDDSRVFKDVSDFVGGKAPHPAFAVPNDTGTVRFNHKVHLDERGVLLARSDTRKVLDCNDCHQLDSTRRYMQPIRYAKHCAECHPLGVQVFGELADGPVRDAANQFRETPAPHPAPGESAATLRAVLRERYVSLAHDFPVVLGDAGRPPSTLPRPGRDRRAGTPSIVKEADWANGQVQQAARLLFEGAGGCRYCHQEAAEAARNDLPAFALPMIKDRWLVHSTFNHDSHRSLGCQQCHENTNKSQLTRDVLMPTIETCRKCHNGGTPSARTDCVECHSYHDSNASRRPQRDLMIEDFLKGLGARSR